MYYLIFRKRLKITKAWCFQQNIPKRKKLGLCDGIDWTIQNIGKKFSFILYSFSQFKVQIASQGDICSLILVTSSFVELQTETWSYSIAYSLNTIHVV